MMVHQVMSTLQQAQKMLDLNGVLHAVMAVTVGCMSLVAERLWVVLPASPYFASGAALGVSASCILFGGLIAFLMVWVEFTVIQETSALTFMVAGTFKEIVTGMILYTCYIVQFACSRLKECLMSSKSGDESAGLVICSRVRGYLPR